MMSPLNWPRRILAPFVYGLLALGLSACDSEEPAPTAPQTSDEVNIYSYRQEALIKPLLDAFSEETGIRVNVVSGNADGLLERLKAEGAQSPADLLLTTDVARASRALEAGVLRATPSAELFALVPDAYRHPEGYWYGLSMRARVIFYAADRVTAEELSNYAGLADPKWRKRICVRSSSSPYNQSLLASIIAHEGPNFAEQWAAAIVANMARTPNGGDRDQIKAVAAGECDVAIANSYYYGTMLAEPPSSADYQAAQQVKIFWPNQDGRGAHVNISAAAVTASSRNTANAVALISFLASDKAQRIYAEQNFEYPIRDNVPLSPILESWGKFKADDLQLAELGEHNRTAVEIFDRVGWR